MKISAVTRETGIVRVIIRLLLHSLRNAKTTIITKRSAHHNVSLRFLIDCVTISSWVSTWLTFTSEGSIFSISVIRAFTFSITSSEFLPDCFCTITTDAFPTLVLAYSSDSRKLSSMVATSERRTILPRKLVIGICASSSVVEISAGILTGKSFVPTLIFPPGMLMFSSFSIVASSETDM